jgi:adenylyl-sulfate kinase
VIVWLTGLPCSGKTTLGRAVTRSLFAGCHRVAFLDGDAIRKELWPELGFSESDRRENTRRFSYLANLLHEHGLIAVVATVSPYRSSRDLARQHNWNFIEVYVNAPAAICEQRDVKGMYRKAHLGEIQHFTGVSDPYEAPLSPEVECRTDQETVEQSADKILEAVYTKIRTTQQHQQFIVNRKEPL